MKILAQAIPENTMSGFQRAAEHAGHKWIWWEEQHTPAFDAFDEIKPDLVMLMRFTKPLSKCLIESGIPIVMGYFDSPFSFNINEERGLDCERLVDAHMFSPGDVHPAYICPLGIVSNPSPMGLHLLDKIDCVKIMCEEAWPSYQYLGIPTMMDKRDLYRSSSVVLIHDMIEAMRVIACGSIPISDADDLHDDIPGMTSGELADFVHEMVRNPQTHEEITQHLQRLTVNRTYDTALNTILESIQ
jgi:hypothetical protein